MAHKLVIVESPAKARTIGGYLGKDYVVESSIGHIRDLPNNAADTPAKIKDKPWGRLAVDVDNEFTPYYVVPRDKKAHISKLKSLLKAVCRKRQVVGFDVVELMPRPGILAPDFLAARLTYQLMAFVLSFEPSAFGKGESR